MLDLGQAMRTANCAEKARVREKLPGEKESVVSRSFQRPLGFVSSNKEVSRELAGQISASAVEQIKISIKIQHRILRVQQNMP